MPIYSILVRDRKKANWGERERERELSHSHGLQLVQKPQTFHTQNQPT